MALALLGDVLLYAVLPLHAEAFGIGLVWVGILLSVNRFIRVFAYGLISRITEKVGARNMAIVAVIGASASTLMYGVVDGPWILLFARAMWGLCYATLVLTVLAYAITDRTRTGTRVGVSQSTQSIGPLAVLLGGTWLVTVIGPRDIFIWLAVLSIAALPIAWSLPRTAGETRRISKTPTPRSLRPSALDAVLFILAVVVDGLFSFSATLMMAERVSVSTAVIGGGALLAMRDISHLIVSPIAGFIGDRLGAERIFLIALGIVVIGLALIGAGWLITGAFVMLSAKSAAMALAPAVVVQNTSESQSVMPTIARIQAARDLGAAIGPLLAGVLIAYATTREQHMGAAVVLALATGLFAINAMRKKQNQ